MQQLTKTPDTLITQDGLALQAEWISPHSHETASTIAILQPGSGSTGLDGDVSSPLIGSGYRGGPTDLSAQLAHALGIKGVSSFRYAKRGHQDASQVENQILPFLVDDAVSAIEHVQAKHPNAKIVLVGFSEGALVSLLATQRVQSTSALFLLALPFRPIDDVIRFQCVEWPIRSIKRHFQSDSNDILDRSKLEQLPNDQCFPMLGNAFQGLHWSALDSDGDGQLSLSKDVQPAYEAVHAAFAGLLTSPAFARWYKALKELESPQSLAAKTRIPVSLYHGTEDAQVDCEWIEKDASLFPNLKATQYFEGLGHCFSPMEGQFGQIRTAGPFSKNLLERLSSDVAGIKL